MKNEKAIAATLIICNIDGNSSGRSEGKGKKEKHLLNFDEASCKNDTKILDATLPAIPKELAKNV